ncbi:MAG TPA: orotidine-5'-phosphate decarboxylase [Parasegetibacter sp.]|jgi:orotidine-5'-phosphate decarboxylase
MNRQELIAQIRKKKTYLCVGLDSDITKIPRHLLSFPDPVFEFNRRIIDATRECCVSYKINTAFYESRGMKGWESLERTIKYIPETHFTIADAKRGDIGNTSAHYAKTFFETYNFDAVTVAPYMGEDSLRPFLEYKDKFTIILGLTSNPGAADFELEMMGNEKLYEKVLRKTSEWGTINNTMYVVGATRADEFTNIRKILPDHFYLVPGVGAQGGSLAEISQKAMNADIGLLVNASRAVIFASSGEEFAEDAGKAAKALADEMSGYIR